MPIPVMPRLRVRWRLAFWYTLVLVIILALSDVLLIATLRARTRQAVDNMLVRRAARLEMDLAEGGLDDLASIDVRLVALGTFFQMLDADGRQLVYASDIHGSTVQAPSMLIEQALGGRRDFADVSAGDQRIRMLAHPLTSDGRVAGVLILGETLSFSDEILLQNGWLFGIQIVAAALLAMVGSWWFASRTLEPVTEVTRVAKQIATTGHLEERVAVPPTHDELRELASTLNEMLARLEGNVRRQRQFLADASHELRGPLMVIRGNLDLLQMDLPPEELRASAAEASEEAERMARLVGDLLFLAEEDAHERMQSEVVPLHEVVLEIWQRAHNLDSGAHELVLACNDQARVLGDRYRLTQMLWNLVENALRYTNVSGTITLCLRTMGQSAEVTITDTGIGIPSEHLPHLFERFYRVDRARSRNESSTGLGLPIVKQVVEAHGGQIHVHSELGSGSTFTVVLPTI